MVYVIQKTLSVCAPSHCNFLRRAAILSPTERVAVSHGSFERLSARVRVKRSGSSVLAVPSHASRGACCHCQYPQSRNDQRVPTRADGDPHRIDPFWWTHRAGYIKGLESVPPPRFRPWRRRDDRIITRQDAPSVTSCRNSILRNRNNCREWWEFNRRGPLWRNRSIYQSTATSTSRHGKWCPRSFRTPLMCVFSINSSQSDADYDVLLCRRFRRASFTLLVIQDI